MLLLTADLYDECTAESAQRSDWERLQLLRQLLQLHTCKYSVVLVHTVHSIHSCRNSVSCVSQSALQFLEAYGHEDVTVAELQGSSNSLWTISPPSRQYLSQVLNLDHFPLTVSWTVQRSALSNQSSILINKSP